MKVEINGRTLHAVPSSSCWTTARMKHQCAFAGNHGDPDANYEDCIASKCNTRESAQVCFITPEQYAQHVASRMTS